MSCYINTGFENVYNKTKDCFFLGFLLLYTPLILGGMYIFIDSLVEYLSFPESFIFSSLIIYCAFGAIILIIFSALLYHPVFLGKKAPVNIQQKTSKIMFLLVILSVIFQISFKYKFTFEVYNRGYVSCKGIPSSWMPGMATKYAINESLCQK